MNTARSAIASATFTDCSTMTIVRPCALSPSTTSRSCCTTSGASPSDSSSMSRSSGSSITAFDSASICCSTARQRPARGVRGGRGPPGTCSSAASMRSARRRRVLDEPAPDLEVLGHGLVREERFAAGDLDHPHRHPDLGIGERDGAAVHADHAAVGEDEPADRAQQRRLAGAVGAEQREHFAALHLEVDVEEDLQRAVAHVEVVHLEHRARRPGSAAIRRCSSCSSSSSSTTSEMSRFMNRRPTARGSRRSARPSGTTTRSAVRSP